MSLTRRGPRRPAANALQCLFSDAVIQMCLTIKMVLGLPLRQTTVFAQSRVS
ncbi:transposase [Epibacterium ulvae]|uniref:transposase n=1 Tax=Epibacterium ulvae TaxID=1156985 RepID=UPI003F72AFDC